MNEFLHFSEHRLQEIALVFMALVYTIRIVWFLRFKAGKERQGQTGAPSTTPKKGILYSWANIAMPWAMESTRTKFFSMYLPFVIFHLGVAVAILLSFVIPYVPSVLSFGVVVLGFQIVTGAACLVGLIRMVRRVGDVYMRAISSPDDYFSLILLTVWLGSATLAAPFGAVDPHELATTGFGLRLTFFLLTAFFLIYVPFSKISHYLYYPFTRYYFGKTMGYRGVYPVQRKSETN
jgi:nitrate reductase gamma subunit